MDFLIWKYWEKTLFQTAKFTEKIIIFLHTESRVGERRKKFYLLKVRKAENAKFAKEWQKT